MDVPKDTGSKLRILLDDAKTSEKSMLTEFTVLSSIFSGGGFSTMSGPASAADFTCYAVNITGTGIAGSSQQLQNCTSSTNMHGHGIGLITQPTPRGSTIEVDIPAGTGRNIDVYGVYPPTTECGGGTSGSTSGGGGGYFLGGTTADLTQATNTVSITTSYTAGTAADVNCQGDNTKTPFIGSVNPDGGDSTITGVSINMNGYVPQNGDSATIGGLACSSFTLGTNGNYVSCGLPTGLTTAGTYDVVYKAGSTGNTATKTGGFQLISSGNWLSFMYGSGSSSSMSRSINFGSATHSTNGSTIDIQVCNQSASAASLATSMTLPSGFAWTSSGTFPGVPTAGTACGTTSIGSHNCCYISIQFQAPATANTYTGTIPLMTAGDNGSSTLTLSGTSL